MYIRFLLPVYTYYLRALFFILIFFILVFIFHFFEYRINNIIFVIFSVLLSSVSLTSGITRLSVWLCIEAIRHFARDLGKLFKFRFYVCFISAFQCFL